MASKIGYETGHIEIKSDTADPLPDEHLLKGSVECVVGGMLNDKHS